MKKLLEAALAGEPWSLSGLVFGLDDVLDEEGRPLHERRAPSVAKTGVPMELQSCPYHDERRGLPMNVSALEQLTRYFPAAAASVAAFRGMTGKIERPWEGMLLALLDLLSSPTLQLLQARDPNRRVSGLAAGGYKLAAGYFDALRRILDLDAREKKHPATAAGFLDFVREHRLLIGPSEACAGPWEHITALSRMFLDAAPPPVPPDPLRVEVARTLAAQVRLGIAWKLVDESAEWALIAAPGAEKLLRPRNHVVEQRLADRRAVLAAVQPANPAQISSALPESPDVHGGSSLRQALEAWAAKGAAGDAMVSALDELLANGDGGFEIPGPGEKAACVRSIADFLVLYRCFVGAQWRLERSLRERLGFPQEAGVKFSSAVLPFSHCLSWVETISGHKLNCAPAALPEIALHHHRRTVLLIPAGQ
jgi:hypothetical protein